MKYLLLLTLLLNLSLLNASDEAEPSLKRSEEVIKGVKTILDAAICSTTGDIYHSECQMNRGAQKCPSCRHWDIHFLDAAVAIDTTLKPCVLCSKQFKTIHGFPKSSSVGNAQ